jgi:PAS domain S-box-containing protein
VKHDSRWGLDPRVAAALAVAVVLVLTVGLAALREQWHTVEAGDWARHTVRVLEQIATVLQCVTDAESGQRGYVLTGDRAYLQPYQRGIAELPRTVDDLRRLTSDNPSQQARFDALAPLLAAKLEEMRLVVSQRESGDAAGALATIRGGVGKDVMDQIRKNLNEAAGEERGLLRERIDQREVLAARSTRLILAESLTALLLMSAAAGVLAALLRRAQAAEFLRRTSEQRLRVTLRSIGDAVIATDAQGLVVFMNPVAETLTGWDVDAARGRDLPEVFRIVNAETRNAVESPAARVLREGVVVGLANHTVLLARDGREIPIDDSGAPIRDAGGELMGVVLVFRDVTEREARERERRRIQWAEAARVAAERTSDALEEARADAARANEAKDTFLATLSHELRSPLSALLAWVSILRRRGDDPATRERAIGVLERSVRTQTQLINDLLDVSRIVSGKLGLEVAPVDLAAELPECLEALRPAADAKGVALEGDLSRNPMVVLGDEARLEQVIRNLIDNAIKFTPSGGRVRVRLQQLDREAELTVSDTGEGFPPELRATIFDRFQQSRNPRTRQHGGLGLGLAIVRHLIEAHGGTVSADSPGPGRGATFRIRIPLADGLAALRSVPGRAEEPPVDLRGVSVLLVEDDADWRDAVALRLKQAGARVTTASSVADALELLDAVRPRVLVSDIGMPHVDGYELISLVRARPGTRLTAVAMTGFADPESRERCINLGFDDFIAKPFEPGLLITRLGTLLGLS